MESRTGNSAQGIRNPASYCNPESKFHLPGIRYPVHIVRNPLPIVRNPLPIVWNPLPILRSPESTCYNPESTTYNPESTTYSPESTTWYPEYKTVLDYTSHGATLRNKVVSVLHLMFDVSLQFLIFGRSLILQFLIKYFFFKSNDSTYFHNVWR